jgi:FAD/FMN-containing dehydrogenase
VPVFCRFHEYLTNVLLLPSVLGKRTGKGALGIWTHHIDFIKAQLNYTSTAYTGAALKMGTGVQGGAAYAAAHRLGHRIVGSLCPTVGLAGSFAQGGGHSPLTALHGLGADNVLEWEVVTANGTHAVASPTSQPDLYWALTGGGSGTYAVIVSMTVRMHRDNVATIGARLDVNASLAPSATAFWAAVDAAHARLAAAVVNAGAYAALTLTNASASIVVTAPGQPVARVRDLLQHATAYLNRQRIAYTQNVSVNESYYAHFDRYYSPLPNSLWLASDLATSRIMPAVVLRDATQRAALVRLYRTVAAEPGWFALHLALQAPADGTVAVNAVHPAWRSAGALALLFAPWDWRALASVTAAQLARLNGVVEPAARALLPQAPPYLNEANYAAPNVVAALFGPNLLRLHHVKAAYDATDLLYAPYGMRSEAWEPDVDGWLCRPT